MDIFNFHIIYRIIIRYKDIFKKKLIHLKRN
jgi:hypothetical protein